MEWTLDEAYHNQGALTRTNVICRWRTLYRKVIPHMTAWSSYIFPSLSSLYLIADASVQIAHWKTPIRTYLVGLNELPYRIKDGKSKELKKAATCTYSDRVNGAQHNLSTLGKRSAHNCYSILPEGDTSRYVNVRSQIFSINRTIPRTWNCAK